MVVPSTVGSCLAPFLPAHPTTKKSTFSSELLTYSHEAPSWTAPVSSPYSYDSVVGGDVGDKEGFVIVFDIIWFQVVRKVMFSWCRKCERRSCCPLFYEGEAPFETLSGQLRTRPPQRRTFSENRSFFPCLLISR